MPRRPGGVVQGCTVYGAEDAMVGSGDAREGMRSHAERGNEKNPGGHGANPRKPLLNDWTQSFT